MLYIVKTDSNTIFMASGVNTLDLIKKLKDAGHGLYTISNMKFYEVSETALMVSEWDIKGVFDA